ncbi:RNA/RNP complex-1-interacting phosphatase [Calliphora vicina]|uniref:RNA/RNP complex-1-interacting phosphatase n=1 Tax=Calliphora vicina TaxID=7373 RepID=UPI00325BE79E
MAPAIPDRWKDYKPVGEKIEGTRFIAFKVPLKEHVSNHVESEIRLDGNILLKQIPNLGLIIDLTNTHRYYDPIIFQKKGVKHIKLMTPGKETPPKRLADEFNMIVKHFIESNTDNDKLIGVHCTHGVNRTGYYICNYMISHMTIEPKDALERFSNARGHKIERNNYIDDLHKLLKTNIQNSTIDNWRDRNPQSFNPNQNSTIDNWKDRNPQNVNPNQNSTIDNWRDRNPQNVYPNMDEQAGSYNQGQNSYGNGYDNYRRSPSPPPFYRRPGPQYDPYCRPPALAVQGVGQLRRPTAKSYQPPRLEIDYYSIRPTYSSNQHNRHRQRIAHKRNDKPNDCTK